MNSGSWWWTRRPSVLQSMGLQRVGHDWVTELNWILAWKILWTGEPSSLQSMGSQKSQTWLSEYTRIPIFKLSCCFLCYWVDWVPCIFWILTPYQMCDLQIFSPIPGLSFLFFFFFFWCFLLLYRIFLEWWSYTYLFLLHCLCSWCQIQKYHCQDQYQGAHF